MTLTCQRCGYGLASTWIDPIYEDETDYTLTLLPGNAPEKTLLQAISKTCGCNFLEARKIIASSTPTPIATEKAPEMKRIIERFESCRDACCITPDCPYKKNGGPAGIVPDEKD